MTFNIVTLMEDAGPILTAVEAVMDNATLIEQKAEALLTGFDTLKTSATAEGTSLLGGLETEFTDFVSAIKDGFTSVKSLVQQGKTDLMTTTPAQVTNAPAA